MTCSKRTLVLFAISLVPFSHSSLAQQTSTGSGQEPASQTPPQIEPKDTTKPQPGSQGENVPGSSSKEGAVKGTSNDRLFYALPNFLSLENAGTVPPLTARQKFAVVARSSFDYVLYPWYGFLSAVSQAEDSEPGFGQGAAGYGKRFGSAFADGTIENFITGAILPSVLHQDPRFFQSGKGSFVHRTGYAVSRIFITRTDSGGQQFNYSEVLGSALSATISTYSYHPKGGLVQTPSGLKFIPSDRTLKNTASVWGTQVGYDTLTIVVKEFWPDIHRKLSHKAQKSAPTETAAPHP
jgi:hypothetical protein